MLFAQALAGYSFAHLAIMLIVVVAVVAIVLAGSRAMGITIPPILIKIGTILAVAVLCILAILFLLRIAGA